MASILVIEDDEGIRGLLRIWLEEAGHTVWDTTNGRDGTREFRKAPIDLVITDIYMPLCDGLDVIRRLRRLHAELPILAISGGSGTMDYLRMAQSEGAPACYISLSRSESSSRPWPNFSRNNLTNFSQPTYAAPVSWLIYGVLKGMKEGYARLAPRVASGSPEYQTFCRE